MQTRPLCRADLRVHVGRAGESSPANAKRSEVIGLRHSSSIAEGRTGSFKEHQLWKSIKTRSFFSKALPAGARITRPLGKAWAQPRLR